ncbi:CPBP family intramembrane glutamic endopeptidase [Saccharopolyspora sp. MS10]|uniref:CPBP family intramembrane glutamic endopeptidase n=1 Tax=Saccharopolyspora sp. MS10 TaxID=3385973 RepID=UPI0039A357B6
MVALSPERQRSGLGGFVARRPMLVFFVLAFGLSWAAWVPYVLSDQGMGLVHFRFPELFGSPQLLSLLPGAYLGPIAAAFAVTAIADGRAGLRRWAGRLFRWRVSWVWYAVVLLGVPLLLSLVSLPFSGWEVRMPPAWVFAAYVPALVLQLLTTGLAEEPGWRDFALPRMQPRFGPMLGTLLLGVMWGAWHLPLFLTEWGGYPNVRWTQPFEFVLAAVVFSFVMTWVFNRTGESLPLAMLLHVGVNNFFSVAWLEMFPGVDPHGDSTHIQLIAWSAVGLVLIVATRGRLGYRRAQERG